MKVTVTFGDTAVVVPCKAGWTVRDLIEQATRRYRRILEQVNTQTLTLHRVLEALPSRHVRLNRKCRFIPLIPHISQRARAHNLAEVWVT